MNRVCRGRSVLQRKACTLTSQALRSPDRAFYRSNTFVSDNALGKLLKPELADRIRGYDPFDYLGKFYNKTGPKDHLSRMLYTDFKTYLPGDILVKVDRMSMANSLEVRAPLLDYRVVEFAAGLQSRMKIRWGNKKHLLKKAFSRVLPEQIFQRPKHGFSVPLDLWFQNDLTTLAEEVFFQAPSTADLLDVDYIRKIWDEHRARKAEHGTLLWSILMFSLWHRDLRQRAGKSKGMG
jgi:asparagine synthase (glutamine-hydrolysing)